MKEISMTIYRIFEILLIVSEFDDLSDYLLPHVKKIMTLGYDQFFNLCCVIFGNILGFPRTSDKMLDFVINEEIESMILLRFEEKKYPLQHWLKFCFPYRSVLEKNKYSTSTTFFKKIENLCIAWYLNASIIE